MKSHESKSSPRKAVGNLVMVLSSIVVALLVAELALRAVSGSRVEEQWPVVTQYDSLLGWSLVPGASGKVLTREFEATEDINSLGLRGPELSTEKAPGERRILLLGDSFTEGYTVDQGSTVSGVLEHALRDPNTTVINSGARGWGTDQELLFFTERGSLLEPDLTILLFYINDICSNASDRYWRGSKPRFRVENGGLELTGVPVPKPRPAQASLQTRNLFGQIRDGIESSELYDVVSRATRRLGQDGTGPPPPGWAPWSTVAGAHPCVEEGWEVTDRLLARLRDEVEERGGQFVVFWVPTREAVYPEAWARHLSSNGLNPDEWSPTAEADRLQDICSERELDCVIAHEEFLERAAISRERLFYERDPHWTPAGHEFAARLLKTVVQDRIPAAVEP